MIKQSTSVNSQLLKMGNEIDQRVELFVVIRVHQQLEHWLEGDIPYSKFLLLFVDGARSHADPSMRQ